MIEWHAHLLEHGRSLGMLDLAPCRSAAQVLALVVDRAAARPAHARSAPILGFGARPESWDRAAWPTLADLDRAAGPAPCCLWCFDYHALVANSAALTLAGFDDASPDPAHGVLCRNDRGHLTGLLLESAAGIAWDAVPKRFPELPADPLLAGLEDLARRGYRAVHDLKSRVDLGAQLATLAGDGRLPLAVALFPLVEDLPAVLATRRDWESDAVRLVGGKIFVDGTLNSRTAWMLEPYADARPDHPTGMSMMSAGEIDAALRLCLDAGLQMAAHAIGDGAVRAVLDAAERVRAPRGSVRIEHAEVIHPRDLARFGELGVIASVQPCHLLTDIEALSRAIPDRLDRVLPLRSLLESGLVPGESLLFGSDAPIVPPVAEDSILAATQRRRAGMDARDAIAPAEAIDEPAAWACFNRGEAPV